MSKPTSGSDLFAWAARGMPGARSRASKPPRWAPRRKYGFAAALAVVVEEGRRRVAPPSPRDVRCGAEAKPEPVARCPRCGVEGLVAALFGTRVVDGKRRPQSWCRTCRRARREEQQTPMIREAKLFAEQSVASDDKGLQALPLPLWPGRDS